MGKTTNQPARVTLQQLASAVYFAEGAPHVSRSNVFRVVDIALRNAIGMSGCACGSNDLVVDLGNGFELHCAVRKREGAAS